MLSRSLFFSFFSMNFSMNPSIFNISRRLQLTAFPVVKHSRDLSQRKWSWVALSGLFVGLGLYNIKIRTFYPAVLPPWNKNVPEKIKIDLARFIIYIHQQPLDAKRYKQVSTKATQSNSKQLKATQSNSKQLKATHDHYYQRSLQGSHREHA